MKKCINMTIFYFGTYTNTLNFIFIKKKNRFKFFFNIFIYFERADLKC